MKALEHCLLCPRKCGVNRLLGERGFCKAGNKIKIARAALHYWEEPCLSGEQGSGAIFFSHCTLQCIYCQNYSISTKQFGKELTVSELVAIMLSLQKQGAHNINLVTPTHYLPLIISALKMAKKKGLTIPIVYNTSGYESVETLKHLEGLVDIYLPDMKYYDDRFANLYSKANHYVATCKKAIQEMFRQVGPIKKDKNGILQKGVIVRHLVLPEAKEEAKQISAYLYHTYQDQIYVSIMNQYTPLKQVQMIPTLNHKLTDEHYQEVIDYALDLGIKNAYIQEGDTQSESFIPAFDLEGIVHR